MHGCWIRPALVAVVIATVPLFARVGQADDAADTSWKRSCDRVKDIPLPTGDQPDEGARKALRGCKSEELFYGIGQAADPEKARLCAYLERSAGDELIFGGSAILMTIYATGIGARRNPDLAIHLACAIEGAPAELEYRVAHLEKLKAAPAKKIKFGLCDDVTSGFMMGHCAAHNQRIRGAKREQRYVVQRAQWTAPEQAEFEKLRAAAGAFFSARSAGEVDLSGTARAALQSEEEERLEASFAALLDKLERNAVPPATAAGLADADRKLNAVYQQVMKTEKPDWGSITKDGIREAERKWPMYRDAWADFARLKYPRAGPTAVKVRLTRDRTDMLKAFTPGKP
jgi:uncharacterized protein YecT (DUF1311 family)